MPETRPIRSAVGSDSADFDFADVLDGVPEIANFLFPHMAGTAKARRRTYYLCENHMIPAFKHGDRWHARKGKLRAHYARLEAGEGDAR